MIKIKKIIFNFRIHKIIIFLWKILISANKINKYVL